MACVESLAAEPGSPCDKVAVLLVNDDAGALFALRAVLGDLHADIVTATSGEQALLRLLKQDFCVIVMDVKMAGLDGFETARLVRLRPRSRDTPIIFLTSHRATDLDRSRGFELGAADYVFMPVAPATLKEKVQRFVDDAQASRLPGQASHERASLSRALQRHLANGPGHRATPAPAPVGRAPEQPASADADPDTDTMAAEPAGAYVALLDHLDNWLYASAGYRAEFEAASRPGASYLDIVHPDDRERVRAAIDDAGAHGTQRRLHYRVLGASERYFESDVDPVPVSSLAPTQRMIVSHDVTERKQLQAYIVQQSFHDALTGLPNRLLLLDRIGQATAHRDRLQRGGALLFIELEHFKEINDWLGHAAGDRLLQDVAERLIACVRDGDSVARIGGAEFVVMLVGLQRLEDAALVAEKIIASVSDGCQIEGSELHVTPSLGLAVFPDDGGDPDTLLRNANSALYHAKHEGGGRYCFFAPQMQEAAGRRVALGSALRRAISSGEFVMHYQPKVCASSGAICGFEALIRWQRTDGDWIPPSLFIPIAEETGHIDPIGAWVIEQVALELQRWCARGVDHVPIAVNVSPLQFQRADIAASLAAALHTADIPPGLLEVELTESGIMSNPARAIETLQHIHAQGMAIAIDDFGTGYSSLAYLKRLPVDKLKIDASFVRDITTNANDAAIVLAIIGLAHVLNLTVIAEGVETADQMAFLIEHGCDELQGNYFSAAVSNEDALGLLMRGPFPLAPPTPRTPP